MWAEGGRLYRLVFCGSSKDYAGTLDLGKENSLMNLFRVVYKEHGGRGHGNLICDASLFPGRH